MDDDNAVLMRLATPHGVVTAEYHPDDKGMRYALISTCAHAHTVIHCQTQHSAERLFNEVVALYKRGIPHPYLAVMEW